MQFQSLILPPSLLEQAALLRGEIDALSKPAAALSTPSPMKKAKSARTGKLNVDTNLFEMWPEGDLKDPISKLSPSQGYSQTNSPNRSPSIRSAFSRSPSRRMTQEAQALHEKRMLALESELEEAKTAMDEMHSDLRRRKESYMRREEVLASEIDGLREELRILRGEKRVSDATSAKGQSSETIKALHGQITSELENLLLKQEVALNYNSAVTIRSYADKLNAYEAQIERDKDLKGNSLAQWRERTAEMRADIETTKEIASVIDKRYKESELECNRLRNEFRAQEDDRSLLLAQMVKLRNENKKLSMELVTCSQELEEVKGERDMLISQSQTFNMNPEPQVQESSELTEARESSALRRQLEAERKKARQSQTALDLQTKKQSELLSFLQSALEDARGRQLHSGGSGRSLEPRSSNRPSSAMTTSLSKRPSSAAPSISRPFSAMNSESRDLFTEELMRRESLLLKCLSQAFPRPGAQASQEDEAHRPISATVRPPLPSQFMRPRSAASHPNPSNQPRWDVLDDDFIIDEGDEEELCVPNPSLKVVTSRPWIFDASAIHRDHLASSSGGSGTSTKQTANKPKSATGRLGSWGRPVSAVGKG